MISELKCRKCNFDPFASDKQLSLTSVPHLKQQQLRAKTGRSKQRDPIKHLADLQLCLRVQVQHLCHKLLVAIFFFYFPRRHWYITLRVIFLVSLVTISKIIKTKELGRLTDASPFVPAESSKTPGASGSFQPHHQSPRTTLRPLTAADLGTCTIDRCIAIQIRFDTHIIRNTLINERPDGRPFDPER